MFVTYDTHPDLGSPSKVYDLLTLAGKNYPLAGNAEGSYLTFRSTNALVFVRQSSVHFLLLLTYRSQQGIIVIISGVTTGASHCFLATFSREGRN